jgi:hypothetical protein
MNTPEKELKKIFAWTELDEENRACLAFAINKDGGKAEMESAINGCGIMLFEGLKALAMDNPVLLDILKAVVNTIAYDTTTMYET